MEQLDLFTPPVISLDKYHNTTGLSGEQLRERQMKSGSQNEKILAFFRRHPCLMLTPFEVQHAMYLDKTPITSIRRALSDLTRLGYLTKTDIKRKGPYGADCYCWKLKA